MSLSELYANVKLAAERAAQKAKLTNFSDLWERLASVEVEEVNQHLSKGNETTWFGAIPTWEPTYLTKDTSAQTVLVAGVDGSQIYPFEDSPVKWAYIRGIVYFEGSQWLEADNFIQIDLNKEGVDQQGKTIHFRPMEPREAVDYWRTTLEFELAIQAARKLPQALVLLDNPLLQRNQWKTNPSEKTFQLCDLIESIKFHLIAGYISSPRSHLLANLISLSENQGIYQEPIHIDDSQLMDYGLRIGQRSALFHYNSVENCDLSKRDAVIFLFFVKIADHEIARIEIPQWIAQDANKVDTIHASILRDSKSFSYPQCLMMAHYKVVIPLNIGEELNHLALKVFLENGGRYYQSAKHKIKSPG